MFVYPNPVACLWVPKNNKCTKTFATTEIVSHHGQSLDLIFLIIFLVMNMFDFLHNNSCFPFQVLPTYVNIALSKLHRQCLT